MYGHSNSNNSNSNEIPYGFSTEFTGHFPFPELINSPSSFSLISAPPPLAIPANNNNDYDSLSPLKSELGYSSSGCSSYSSPTSLTSYYGSSPSYGSSSCSSNLMQRSISSQSLQKNINEGFMTPMVSSPTGYSYIESETSPVRKVFSTGDLQVIKNIYV